MPSNDKLPELAELATHPNIKFFMSTTGKLAYRHICYGTNNPVQQTEKNMLLIATVEKEEILKNTLPTTLMDTHYIAAQALYETYAGQLNFLKEHYVAVKKTC